MPPTTEQFKTELGKLTAKDRAELAHFLIESLEGEPDDDWEAAWKVELDRRMAGIENGTVVGIPADEVFAALRAKHP